MNSSRRYPASSMQSSRALCRTSKSPTRSPRRTGIASRINDTNPVSDRDLSPTQTPTHVGGWFFGKKTPPDDDASVPKATVPKTERTNASATPVQTTRAKAISKDDMRWLNEKSRMKRDRQVTRVVKTRMGAFHLEKNEMSETVQRKIDDYIALTETLLPYNTTNETTVADTQNIKQLLNVLIEENAKLMATVGWLYCAKFAEDESPCEGWPFYMAYKATKPQKESSLPAPA